MLILCQLELSMSPLANSPECSSPLSVHKETVLLYLKLETEQHLRTEVDRAVSKRWTNNGILNQISNASTAFTLYHVQKSLSKSPAFSFWLL